MDVHDSKGAIYVSLEEDLRPASYLDLEDMRKLSRPVRFPVIASDITVASFGGGDEFDFLTQSPEQVERDIKVMRWRAKEKYRTAKISFMEGLHKKPLFSIIEDWTRRKAEYARIADYVRFALPFDKGNVRGYVIAPHSLRPLFIPDREEYARIQKRFKYADMSVLNVLKLLWSEHKINRHEYRDAIRRANTGKRQKEKIREMVSRYWESRKGKILKLSKQKLMGRRHPFTFVEQAGLRYRVVLLRSTSESLRRWAELHVSNRSRERIAVIEQEVKQEHKRRLVNGNRYALIEE